MKTKIMIVGMAVFMAVNGFGQTSNSNIPPSFQIGFGVGPNYTKMERYEYYINPIDNRLKRDKINPTSFVSSVILSYTPKFTYKRKDSTGSLVGEPFPAPGWFSFLSSFNLAEFNQTSGFNTQLSGGLGLGANIQNVFQIGLFWDVTQVKTLRDFYAKRTDSTIVINNIPLVSLDEKDSRFFKTEYLSSFSIKFIYMFGNRKDDEKTGLLNKGNKIDW
jgi:hypothetical protein